MKPKFDFTITALGNRIDPQQILEGSEVNGNIKPVLGIGDAKVSIRVPLIGLVTARLRTPNQTTEHHVADMGTHWELLPAEATTHHLP